MDLGLGFGLKLKRDFAEVLQLEAVGLELGVVEGLQLADGPRPRYRLHMSGTEEKPSGRS